jgi:hypothetical protein
MAGVEQPGGGDFGEQKGIRRVVFLEVEGSYPGDSVSEIRK